MDMDQPDPSGVSGATATLLKGIGLTLGIIGLLGSLTGPKMIVRSDVESSSLT